MAAPSGQVVIPRQDMGGMPEEAGLHHGIASWDVAGTYTFIVPKGVTRLLIDLQGAWALGGATSSGGCPVTVTAYCAMAGARCLHWIDVTPGSSITIVVGAAGSNAGSGGNTTCTVAGVTLTAGGGNPGPIAFATTNLNPGTPASMVATSGGNVLAQGSGVGYAVIMW